MRIDELKTLQPEVIRIFENAKKKDKLAHAYLLEADAGAGSYEAALYFAMMLLCKKNNAPCMSCNTCERILYNSCMNVVLIEPIEGMIRREQIDSLRHEYALTSLVDGPQIFIIKDAELMNASSANAMLKFLEEPFPNHYYLLLTSNAQRLLDTIVSRCQVIRLKPISKLTLLSSLESYPDQDLNYAIANLTKDSDTAKELEESEDFKRLFATAKKIVEAEFKRKGRLVEYYFNKPNIFGEFPKSWHYYFFDLMILIYQELLKKLSGKKDYYFKDYLNSINFDFDQNEVLRKIEILNEYEMRLATAVNLDLMYTALFSIL